MTSNNQTNSATSEDQTNMLIPLIIGVTVGVVIIIILIVMMLKRFYFTRRLYQAHDAVKDSSTNNLVEPAVGKSVAEITKPDDHPSEGIIDADAKVIGKPLKDPENTKSSRSEHSATTKTWTSLRPEMSIPGFLEVSTNDFHIIKSLTSGGSSKIFIGEVIQPELKSRVGSSHVAVKIISDKFQGDSKDAVSAFQQEVAMMWFLRNNVNIAKIVGFVQSPQMIVMKLYKKGTLFDAIHRKSSRSIQWSVSHVFYFIIDVAHALNAMHMEGFVHHDVKAPNVLLTREGYRWSAVLTDFGVAKVVEATAMLVSAFKPANANGATVVYASPEVIKYMRGDYVYEGQYRSRLMRAADIYALGILMYETVTRSIPWKKRKAPKVSH